MLTLVFAIWSSLVTYSDGKVITHEGMKSEQLCREVLCSVQWSKTCQQHEDDVVMAKKVEEKRQAEYQASIPAWRARHPCKTTKDWLTCSLPNGGDEVWSKDKNGKYALVSMGSNATFLLSSSFGPAITHAVCFEEKP